MSRLLLRIFKSFRLAFYAPVSRVCCQAAAEGAVKCQSYTGTREPICFILQSDCAGLGAYQGAEAFAVFETRSSRDIALAALPETVQFRGRAYRASVRDMTDAACSLKRHCSQALLSVFPSWSQPRRMSNKHKTARCSNKAGHMLRGRGGGGGAYLHNMHFRRDLQACVARFRNQEFSKSVLA